MSAAGQSRRQPPPPQPRTSSVSSGLFQVEVAKPGSGPPLPEGATRVDLHSAKAKMLARIELKVDPDTALRLQKQFSVTPQGEVAVSPPPVIPEADEAPELPDVRS
jgi:hypothetical protein